MQQTHTSQAPVCAAVEQQRHFDNLKQERNAAVLETITAIRSIHHNDLTRESLRRIEGNLLRLAAKKHLFPESVFPAEEDDRGLFPLYRLAEDDDHSLAMYINSSRGNNDVPPHDHTTWAVTVSIQGTEENRFYEKVGDYSVPGKGQLQLTDSETVRPGVGICMMPDDIHSVHAKNDEPALILHMYGKALDHLTDRSNFDLEAGTCRVAVPTINIIEAR